MTESIDTTTAAAPAETPAPVTAVALPAVPLPAPVAFAAPAPAPAAAPGIDPAALAAAMDLLRSTGAFGAAAPTVAPVNPDHLVLPTNAHGDRVSL